MDRAAGEAHALIPYRIEAGALRRLVERADPRWFTDVAAGKRPSWSRIKSVFFELQKHKCGYCERRLPELGALEQDIEHLRPKARVRHWPAKGSTHAVPRTLKCGRALGYGWLEHEVENYMVACKTCNSARKACYFPIQGEAGGKSSSVKELDLLERPLLVNPIGPRGGDPRKILRFDGILAVPRTQSGRRHDQALTMIHLLALNEREELLFGRFLAIRLCWLLFERSHLASERADRREAREDITRLRGDWNEHAACVRDFHELCEGDPARAWEFDRCARRYLRWDERRSQQGKPQHP